MSYLRYLCLLVYRGVQHILCCVSALFVFFLCLVYPMLPVSLDCPFLIASSLYLTFITQNTTINANIDNHWRCVSCSIKIVYCISILCKYCSISGGYTTLVLLHTLEGVT